MGDLLNLGISSTGRPQKGKTIRVILLGMLAFMNAIACCSWPAVLNVVGIGSAGLSKFIIKWQPALTGSSYLFLGIAFYAVYFSRGGMSCKRSLSAQVILWTSAIGTLYFTIPYVTNLVSALSHL